MDLLIDDAGEVWLNGSTALRHRLGISPPDDLAKHAVHHEGFILVRMREGTIRLTLRAGRFQFRALESVVRLVLGESWRRLVIEHTDRMPSFEIHHQIEEAVARLKDLGVPSPLLVPRDPFFNQERSLDRLNEAGQQALRGLMRLWRNRRGDLAPDRILELVPDALKPRMNLTRMTAAGAARNRALVEHMGSGFRVFDACWAVGAIGRDLEEQPDPAYGARSARSYHEVAALGRPRLELVDAIIDVPGRPVRRSRYDRLMLPFRARGETFVCGASVLRSSYPLEPAAAIHASRS